MGGSGSRRGPGGRRRRSGGRGRGPGGRRWRLTALVAGLAALALAASACGSSGSGSGNGSSGSDDKADTAALGTRQVAAGTPVKIGVLSDGQAVAYDHSIQVRAAAAMAKYLNDYQGGIGGRPIQLVQCQTAGDPAKAADCATQFIQSKVTITVLGEATGLATVWKPLHDARIPVLAFGTTEQSALLDKDSTFVLGDQIAALASLPIEVARESRVKKITAIVIDVPAATGFYETVGKQMFQKAGFDFQLIKVPPGQADMSPQIGQIVRGGSTEVHIIGNDSFCIAALNGLRAANFKGPISILGLCASASLTKSVGSYLKGVNEATTIAIGDSANKDLTQWKAIVGAYAKKNRVDPTDPVGAEMYIVLKALREQLDGITGDITAQTVTAKIRSAPQISFPMAPGIPVRCDGTSFPLTPAVCGRGVLLTKLDADGKHTLPYRALGTSGS
ncbi:ABC transporter substrate-binding protein [Frankia sp. AiPa1]|uniref:ABC transporter substrate-binding protein n=1 Tax=Frankia sp. AiPa1 TaxID=573492 RepID=UPI00202B7F35|nr:ABC transporter substrate-binding protein [Frankia sp. AiPa1]MCL9760001.1 ABC transporter substrate-binding protein [Frankia sp. AiPa1]